MWTHVSSDVMFLSEKLSRVCHDYAESRGIIHVAMDDQLLVIGTLLLRAMIFLSIQSARDIGNSR